MTTTMQIRADVKTAERFKDIWERLNTPTSEYTQGETLELALDALEQKLNNRHEDAR